MSTRPHLAHPMFVFALASALPAQVVTSTQFGAPSERLASHVARIADVDGDGRDDLLMDYQAGAFVRVALVSTATGQRLGTTSANGAGSEHNPLRMGVPDLNGDNVPDFVVRDGDAVRACSGVDASQVWVTSALLECVNAVLIDDVSGDLVPDFVVWIRDNHNDVLTLLNGATGGQFGPTYAMPNSTAQIVGAGDQNGDGRPDVAIGSARQIVLVRADPFGTIRTLAPTGTTPGFSWIAAANVAGDSRPEVLGFDYNARLIRSYAAGTGIPGMTYRSLANGSRSFAVMEDLDSDGYDELAVFEPDDRFGMTVNSNVVLKSGVRGTDLGYVSATSNFEAGSMACVGDIDGDGAPDLILGDPSANPVGLRSGSGTSTGAWRVVSGRLLASQHSFDVQCTAGPFRPQIGMTRPVLGQPLTFVGRDCPTTAPGTLVMSLQPDGPLVLGFVGCDLWLDLGTAIGLYLPPASASWTFSFPLPNIPQLAGFGVAFQAFWSPTNSPIGVDLSNAFWARFGY